jgi:hypothetical protein
MSKIITAWAVVDRDGRVLGLHRSKEWADDAAAGATVVELTGQLPDPPRRVMFDETTWVKGDTAWSPIGSSDHIAVNGLAGKLLDRIWELEQQIGGAS